jgi:outer membrane protein assembly factor BamB
VRTGTPLSLPRWWVAVLAACVLVVVAAVVVVVRATVPPCRDALVDDPRSPLLSPARMAEQPDERLDVLTAAVDDLDAPFGDVLAGVGYDYDQWLHLYGIEGGVLAFTKNNAPVTLLDAETLEVRWSLRPERKRTAWDASGDRFLLLDLAEDEETHVSAYDVADGHRVWCASVGQSHSPDDPVSTTFLGNGDALTALPDGRRVTLTRLAADSGDQVWSRTYASLARADYLGPLTDDLMVAGGSEEFRLSEPDPDAGGGPAITALRTGDGRPEWTWSADPGAVAHVVGADAGRAVVVERGAGGVRMFALSDAGTEEWSVTPEDSAFEATLRDGVVVMRSAGALYGYDAATGGQLWKKPVPTDRTYFPYGFTLGQMPSLDDAHLLVPTTSELVVLDVHDGTQAAHPLPVDGISTTYWPYQLMATPDLLGVVTNTGAVVARRVGA